LKRDPIGFESKDYNFYRYVLNNPNVWLDPYGFDNQSGRGTVTSFSVGAFNMLGSEMGFEKLKLDNGCCQWFFYVGFGVGVGASGSLQDGNVYNVFDFSDYEEGFVSVSLGYGPGGESFSIAPELPYAPSSGAYSITGGFSNPLKKGFRFGGSGTLRYYTRVGDPFPCEE
jgi:hypothetical protein